MSAEDYCRQKENCADICLLFSICTTDFFIFSDLFAVFYSLLENRPELQFAL